jgi:outer membrane protein assembly factor BamB
MRRATVTLLVAGALIATGCSDSERVFHNAAAAPRHSAAAEPLRAPVNHLEVADYTDSLSGEPGGMATDKSGAVVEVDDRTVIAFNTTGEQQWSSPVPGAALGWPLLSDQLVVVPTLSAHGLGETDGHSGADDSGGCVALDRATGARRWSYEEAGKSGVSVASAGSRVFCLFMNGVIAAVDRDTGKLLWRVLVDPRVPAEPVAVAERSALSIDAASGTMALTVRWAGHWMLIVRNLSTGAGFGGFDLGVKSPPSSPVYVAPGQVAVGANDRVCRYDLPHSRSVCGVVKVPDGFDPASVPVVADGSFVVVGRAGGVVAIDIKTWKKTWAREWPDAVLDARPVISDGVVLFADWTRAPWALRMSDGSQVKTPEPDGFVLSTAADPAGGFAVAIRADIDGRVERWVPKQ